MLILFSHALAFSVLLVAAVYDLKTSEVPDYILLPGIVGGVLLHGLYSIQVWSITPLLWSLGVGIAFSIYGWLAYFKGMWGGADAMAISVLGFAAPFGLDNIEVIFAVDMFLNILYIGFIYTILFSLFKAHKHINLYQSLLDHIRNNKKLLLFEFGGLTGFTIFILYFGGFNLVYPILLFSMIALIHFLQIVESNVFRREVPVSDVSPGEVVESEEVDGKIKGITEEELEKIKSETVVVKEGILFVPVFPAALLITDVFGGGVETVLWISEILFS